MLKERAQALARRHFPAYSYDGAQGLDGLVGEAVSAPRAVTSVHDIVTDAKTVRAYQELVTEGRLPLRVTMLIRIIEADIVPASLLNLGIGPGFGNEWLRIGGVKMSVDGGLHRAQCALFRALCRRVLQLRHDSHPIGRARKHGGRLSSRGPARLHPRDGRRGHGHGARRARQIHHRAPALRPPPSHRAHGQQHVHARSDRSHEAAGHPADPQCRVPASCRGIDAGMPGSATHEEGIQSAPDSSMPDFRSRRARTLRAIGRSMCYGISARPSRGGPGRAALSSPKRVWPSRKRSACAR